MGACFARGLDLISKGSFQPLQLWFCIFCVKLPFLTQRDHFATASISKHVSSKLTTVKYCLLFRSDLQWALEIYISRSPSATGYFTTMKLSIRYVSAFSISSKEGMDLKPPAKPILTAFIFEYFLFPGAHGFLNSEPINRSCHLLQLARIAS